MVKKVFPTQAADYDLLEEIGHGAYAVVYCGFCKPLNETVAIKRLDLDAFDGDLAKVYVEAQIMSLVDHPNIIKAYCSFIVDHFLWVVMPYMDGGSCFHLMKIQFSEGLEEPVIATILKETLKGLDYLHQQQQIHRDVKAGNILIDASGAVKLGDFGTSACMFNRGDKQRCRKTVTGTPCWMAPEVLEEKFGYDCRADIWSFGITALELAHGHAPFSKYPPQKVLLMTITSTAPSLDREKDKHFSKAFKEVIKLCLNKDPSRRPTTEKLLKHPFFKNTKSNTRVVKKLINGLGPLWEREKVLRDKDAALLAARKPPFLQEEERSRNEYKRGVSCWNFDIESLKDQAASIHDGNEISSTNDEHAANFPCGEETRQPLTLDTLRSRISFDREPKQFGRFGVFDGDLELESPGWHVVRPIRSTKDAQKLPAIVEDKGKNYSIDRGMGDSNISNGPFMDAFPNGESFERHDIDSNGEISNEDGNSNGVVGCSSPRKKVISHYSDSVESVVEKHKETQSSKESASVSNFQDTNLSQVKSIPASHLGPQLKSLLLQTAKQYEVLADLLRIASPDERTNVPLCVVDNKVLSERESEDFDLAFNRHSDVDSQIQIHELQSKVASLTKELTFFKQRNAQLERELNAIYNRQEVERIRQDEEKKEDSCIH